jgi:shikimate kinase
MNRLVLAGAMGAGKTTVGRLVAERLGWPYLDNDAGLGRTPADVAEAEGVEALHEAEARVLLAALARDRVVVAAPGSAALDPALRARLRAETVVWLRARAETLAARVAGSGRPFAGADVAALLAEREPGLAEMATYVVDVDGRTPDQVAGEVLRLIGASGS